MNTFNFFYVFTNAVDNNRERFKNLPRHRPKGSGQTKRPEFLESRKPNHAWTFKKKKRCMELYLASLDTYDVQSWMLNKISWWSPSQSGEFPCLPVSARFATYAQWVCSAEKRAFDKWLNSGEIRLTLFRLAENGGKRTMWIFCIKKNLISRLTEGIQSRYN